MSSELPFDLKKVSKEIAEKVSSQREALFNAITTEIKKRGLQDYSFLILHEIGTIISSSKQA